MEKWFIIRKGADFEAIAKKFEIHPLLARLIRNRDVISEEEIQLYLNGTIADLSDGMLMRDMDKAVEILEAKIKQGHRIRIIGDYDIDGINATYILLQGIEQLGGLVDYDIPDRIKDGYGISQDMIDRAFQAGIDTIVTCDNGVSARVEIEHAKELGLTVIITDHHDIPYEEVGDEKRYLFPEEEAVGERRYLFPEADAIVNPKRFDCNYPFSELCGAAVAYKLTEALYSAMGKDVKEIHHFIENVAIATIGDVMDLKGENRIITKLGLKMLKETSNLGLKSLMECNEINVDALSSYHIGFVLGPCLNASGRIDTAKRAVELLRVSSKKEADILAGDLKALNDNRKDMTKIALEQALEQIEATSIEKNHVIVVYLKDCHESLAGIIAGRIRDRYYRPTFVLTDAMEGVKGSGRSIDSYDMFEGLSKCKSILSKYGGHKLAAGLSIERVDQVEEFERMINDSAELSEEDLCERVSIDIHMPFSYVTEELVEQLEMLEPFGKGNNKPVFVERDVKVESARIMGKNANVLKMKLQDGHGTWMEGIYFRNVDRMLNDMREHFGEEAVECLLEGRPNSIRIAFTYYPGVNEYRGDRTLQVVILNYRI